MHFQFIRGDGINTVSSEMFARSLFWRIFANLVAREFKVLANKEHLIAITLVLEFKTDIIFTKA